MKNKTLHQLISMIETYANLNNITIRAALTPKPKTMQDLIRERIEESGCVIVEPVSRTLKEIKGWKFVSASNPNEPSLWQYTNGNIESIITCLENFNAEVKEIQEDVYFITNYPVDYAGSTTPPKYVLKKCSFEEFAHISNYYVWVHEDTEVIIYDVVGDFSKWNTNGDHFKNKS